MSIVHVTIMLMLIAANGSTKTRKKQQKHMNHNNHKKRISLVSNSTKLSNFSSLADKLSVLAEVRCPNDAAWKSQVAKILYPVVASRLSPPRKGTFDL